jgi:hypothetical protein
MSSVLPPPPLWRPEGAPLRALSPGGDLKVRRYAYSPCGDLKVRRYAYSPGGDLKVRRYAHPPPPRPCSGT